MCLRNVKFATDYINGLGYIGYGWKCGLTVPKVGVWYEANGDRWSSPNESEESDKKIRNIKSSNGKDYPAGFHIFLDKEDAILYGVCSNIYRVAFSNILAFGKNDTRGRKSGDCIITQHIFYFPLEENNL